LIKKLNF